jgi:hypothetical protein
MVTGSHESFVTSPRAPGVMVDASIACESRQSVIVPRGGGGAADTARVGAGVYRMFENQAPRPNALAQTATPDPPVPARRGTTSRGQYHHSEE